MIDNKNVSVLTSLTRGRFKALCGISPSGQGHDKCATAHKHTCPHAPSLCFYTQKSEPLVHHSCIILKNCPYTDGLGINKDPTVLEVIPPHTQFKMWGHVHRPWDRKNKKMAAQKNTSIMTWGQFHSCVRVCVFSVYPFQGIGMPRTLRDLRYAKTSCIRVNSTDTAGTHTSWPKICFMVNGFQILKPLNTQTWSVLLHPHTHLCTSVFVRTYTDLMHPPAS